MVLLVSMFLISVLGGVRFVGKVSAEGPYDWPMFHHDLQHTGYSASPAPSTNQTLWSYTTGGDVGCAPAVADGKVYVGSNDDNVYCLDAATGAKVWNYTTGGDIYSCPAVVDGRVYVGSNDNKTYCLNAATGASIWSHTAGGWVTGSPSVADGRVYVGSDDNKTYCLNASTGTEIWNYTTGKRVSPPAVSDGKVYVGSADKNLYCLNALSGALLWNYTTRGGVESSPAVVDGNVYVGSWDKKVYCLNAATGALIWNYTTGNWVASSPAVVDGKVYVGSYDNKVYCLNAATGTQIWNYTTGGDVYSSPAVADGKVYIGSYDDKVYCLDTATGAFIWSYTTGDNVYSCPAVANGVVYVGSNDNKVYAFSSGWSRTYGGAGYDMGGGETVQTGDGGYAISGETNSSGAGGLDFWLFKTDAGGNMQWNKTYGGAFNENIGDMRQTSDGGYAILGYTTSFGAGNQDVWLVKTDAAGNMQWNKTYGGTGDEWAISVVQTSEGGYALLGYTSSFGAGSEDLYLVKTDAVGNMLWNKTYGGPNVEEGRSVVQTSDGGYALAGYTNSSGAGGSDFWLVKTDAAGNMLWNKTYGGTGSDYCENLIRTSDGGYAMTGHGTSFGGYKAYLVKTDANGNMQWNKTYGGAIEIGIHVIQTAVDGGYAIVGWNYVSGQNLLLIKTNATGDMLWKQNYGGTGIENGYSVVSTGDGGYILTGLTTSFGAGGNDVWLVKVDENGVIPEGLTIVVIMLLSSIAAAIGTFCFRKPRRIIN